jgi:dephospho-CoA kinase
LLKLKKMFLIGLTGGIASGKSTVSSIINKEYGIPIIDADLIARQGEKNKLHF